MGELLLIPVPGSTPAGDPVLRVVVVPRLDARDSLAGTAMADWPGALGAATFDVDLGGQTTTGLAPLHSADADVWRAFVERLRVDPAPSPGAAGPPPQVEATSGNVKKIDTTYRESAKADIDLATAEQPALDQAISTQLRDNWTPPTAEPADPDSLLEPIFDPFDLPVTEEPMTPPPGFARDGTSRASALDPDFHQVLAMLREHPRVGRALGLVFELPIDAARLPAGSSGTVQVRWPQPPAGLPPVVPLTTAFEVHERRGFLPASTDTVNAGLVDVGDDARWGTATVDVDGAVGRLRDAAAAVAAGETARLPALRSAGIALLRRDRREEFSRRRARASAAARGTAAGGPSLDADDLMLGLRLDVRFRGGDTWSSLCRREATYRVDDRQIGGTFEEEGHVKAGAAVQHEGDVLRADEVVTRWAGWSLTVPNGRPGSQGGDGRRADLPFAFSWDFRVPDGSLLPLRFGRSYHLRVRVADIAGGGVRVDDGDMSLATAPIAYARYEPVGSPLLALASGLDPARLGPGGTLEHVVVRSDAPDYPRNDARVLSAPHTTLDVAEQHGELDGADEATFAIVRGALAEGRLPDPASEGVTVFPRPEPGAPTARTLQLGWPGNWPEAGPRRLELHRREAGTAGPVVDDVGGVIRVRLAPAEQLTLELSSFLKDGYLDQLALHEWRGTSLPKEVVENGRHPMATPAVPVTLVHAVRKPIDAPAGPIEVERVELATDATLVPGPPTLGVDPASTAELQVTASWKDVDDSDVTQVTDAPVQVVRLERGDTGLPPLRHDLASTRHRRVGYTLTAVSRFRHLFDEDEDPERFVERTTLAPVSIPSTARPVAPRVVTVVPSFEWVENEAAPPGVIERHRNAAGRLRVELARPWFSTGEFEHLGIVLAETVPVAPELRGFASEVTRDPVFFTHGAPPDRWLREESFRGMIRPPTSVRLAEAEGNVIVAPYMVHSHENGWSVDVHVEGTEGNAYRPFVRLVVARYQPNSLPGLELSPVVRCPLVQTLPDRTLTVDDTSPGRVTVALRGRIVPGGGMANRVEAILERCLDAPGGSAAGVAATAFAGTEPAGMPVWVPVEGAVASGALRNELVLPRPDGVGPLRVRVREVESLQPIPGAMMGTAGELADRVIFTDVVPLS